MRRHIVLLITLFIAFFAVEGFNQEGSKVIVKRGDNGKEITVKKGGVIQIEMEVLGGAGFIWEFEDLDSEHLEILREETEGIPKEGFMGAPTIKIWQLMAKKAGETEVTMYCFRPWESKDKAIGKFEIKVKIFK
jgi:predicted secreted protein